MKFLMTLAFLWLSLFQVAAQDEFCLAEDLKKLDKAVLQVDIYDQAKQKDIENAKLTLSNCVTPTETYNCYEQLYHKYMKWNPDTARYYAQQEMKIAQENGWEDRYTRAYIQDTYMLVIAGNLLDASENINKLKDIKEMTQENQHLMAILVLEFSLRTELGGIDDLLTKDCREMWKTYSPYLPKTDWRYLYYETMILKHVSLQSLLHELEHSEQPSYKAAALYLACSKVYYEQKNYNRGIHYLILSAINDIETSNKETTSLLYLINSPHVCLNPDQAFQYAMLCTENARIFKDQGRSLEIVKAHAKITKNYQWLLQMRNYVLYAIVALLGIAIFIAILLLRKNSKKKKELSCLLAKLEESNNSLQSMIEKDKETQAQLHTANGLLKNEINYHNQNFFNVYHLISKYITDVQEYKKLVYNLVTAGKYDKARRELSSNSSAEKYLKNFFAHFDQAFLLSHPDFIKRFNALLRPECQIQPSAPNTLTPELRIYALVSIGITDSVSIAQFLHYSTQTVYNYRLKVRHGSCVDERIFAKIVAKMYDDDNQKENGQETAG